MSHNRKQFGDIWYTEISPGHWRKSAIQGPRTNEIVFVPLDEGGTCDYSKARKLTMVKSLEVTAIKSLEDPMDSTFIFNPNQDIELTLNVDVDPVIVNKLSKIGCPNPASPEELRKALKLYEETDL